MQVRKSLRVFKLNFTIKGQRNDFVVDMFFKNAGANIIVSLHSQLYHWHLSDCTTFVMYHNVIICTMSYNVINSHVLQCHTYNVISILLLVLVFS